MKIKMYKYIRAILILFFGCFLAETSSGQPVWKWDLLTNCMMTSIIQDYDEGYLMTGTSTTDISSGFLFKTDINGYLRYRIELKNSNNYDLSLNSISKAGSDAIVVGGSLTFPSYVVKPIVVKFNACREIEWCRLFEMSSNHLKCEEVVQDSEGNFFCLFNPSNDDYTDPYIIVAKMSSSGNMIWMNQYFENPDLFRYPDIKGLILSSDGGVILSGDKGFMPPGFSYYVRRPFWVKLDKDGYEIWSHSFVPTVPYYIWNAGTSNKGLEEVNGTVYCSGSGGWAAYDAGCFYKIKPGGQDSEWHLVSPTLFTWNDQSTTVIKTKTNELFLTNCYSPNLYPGAIVVSRVDTLGTLFKRYFYYNDRFKVSDAVYSTDNHLVYSGTHIAQTEPFGEKVYTAGIEKYDTTLQGGQFNWEPHIYDSLCPNVIVSKVITIPGNCSTVSIPDQMLLEALVTLAISPNPASKFIVIQLPEFEAENKGTGARWNRYRKLEGAMKLQLVSMEGITMCEETLLFPVSNTVMNIQAFPSGVYVLRLLQGETIISRGKVILSK